MTSGDTDLHNYLPRYLSQDQWYVGIFKVGSMIVDMISTPGKAAVSCTHCSVLDAYNR